MGLKLFHSITLGISLVAVGGRKVVHDCIDRLRGFLRPKGFHTSQHLRVPRSILECIGATWAGRSAASPRCSTSSSVAALYCLACTYGRKLFRISEGLSDAAPEHVEAVADLDTALQAATDPRSRHSGGGPEH